MKNFFGECLVDEGDLGRAHAIGRADVAPAQDRRAHHPEEVGRDAIEMRAALALGRVVAGNGDELVPGAVAHRRDDRDRRGFDAGRRRDRLPQPLEDRRPLLVGESGAPQIDEAMSTRS